MQKISELSESMAPEPIEDRSDSEEGAEDSDDESEEEEKEAPVVEAAEDEVPADGEAPGDETVAVEVGSPGKVGLVTCDRFRCYWR